MLSCTGPEEMEEFGARLCESESDDDQDELNYTAVLVSELTSSLVSFQCCFRFVTC